VVIKYTCNNTERAKYHDSGKAERVGKHHWSHYGEHSETGLGLVIWYDESIVIFCVWVCIDSRYHLVYREAQLMQ
jgi:hypothetical protein